MGTYSDIEIKILERLAEVIDNELSSIQLGHTDRDRMLYSTCIDDLEKTNLTKKEIKKMQKKIAKCPPNIAGYVSALLSPYDLEMHNGDYYDFRNNLCKNFISSYPESIEEIAKEYNSVAKVEEDEMYFETVLNDDLYEFDKKEIEHFIKYMSIAERLSIFKTILEEVEENALEIPKNNSLKHINIVKKINNAFFRFESFANGTSLEYNGFDFDTAFSELFYITKKTINYTYENCKRINQYWELTEQIRVDYDQSDFKNLEAYQNSSFCHDCDVITSLNYDRIEEFCEFTTQDEIEAQNKKKSISDIINITAKTENTSKPKTKHHSFTYKNINTGISQLTDLMNALKRKVLIADDTELAVFRKVFSGVSIENPIVWKGNISELSYFIKQLHNELKYVEDLKQQQWVVTINCFIQENGEQYNRKKLRTQKVPSTSKHIDLALKTLK